MTFSSQALLQVQDRWMSLAKDFGIFGYDSVLAIDHVFGLDLLVFTWSWELAFESQLSHRSLTGFWDLRGA